MQVGGIRRDHCEHSHCSWVCITLEQRLPPSPCPLSPISLPAEYTPLNQVQNQGERYQHTLAWQLTHCLPTGSQGQPAFPHVGPPAPSIVKCHDLYGARGCHTRSLGLNDLSSSNTAALWLLPDKCGSLGLTETNVLVYGSQLSAVLREPMGLDLKQGVHRLAI